MSIQAFPLCWPEGWPRTHAGERRSARFSGRAGRFEDTSAGRAWVPRRALTVAAARDRVIEALRMFGVMDGDAIISTNLPLRLDGLPRADARVAGDGSPGAAVYWERPGEKGQRVMALDHYTTVADNLAAVAATLEAMRAIERHGGARILERAFTGFIALPSPAMIGAAARGWRELFGWRDGWTLDQVRDVYRTMASLNHPDRGGSQDRMSAINQAWEAAQRELSRGN